MICFRGLGPVPIVQRACFVLTTFSCRFYVVLVPLFLISRRHHSLIYMLVYLLQLLRVVSFVQQLLSLYGPRQHVLYKYYVVFLFLAGLAF